MIGDIIEIERAKYSIGDVYAPITKAEAETIIRKAPGNPIYAGAADNLCPATGPTDSDAGKFYSFFARWIALMSNSL